MVKIAGELDLSSFDHVSQHCVNDPTRDLVVELSDLTFMDCGGYRAIVAAGADLARHHRTLTVVGAAGEPGRLLDLLADNRLDGSSC